MKHFFFLMNLLMVFYCNAQRASNDLLASSETVKSPTTTIKVLDGNSKPIYGAHVCNGDTILTTSEKGEVFIPLLKKNNYFFSVIYENKSTTGAALFEGASLVNVILK